MVGYLPNHEDLLPGDLLFFMNDKAYVFHVGVYAGDHMYLHSSGLKNVLKSSLLTDGENYLSRYGTSFVHGRRIRF